MSKNLSARIKQKIDTSTHWATAGTKGFIPLKGEIIVYSDLNKIKVGDGETNVSNLEFIDARRSSAVCDYNDATKPIYIGYSGSSLDSCEYLAAYGDDSSGENRVIKDILPSKVSVGHADKATADDDGNNISGNYVKGYSAEDAGYSTINTSFVGGTYNGPLSGSGQWDHIIRSEHRNGGSDGQNYIMEMASSLTADGDIYWRKKWSGGDYTAWRRLVDSANNYVVFEKTMKAGFTLGVTSNALAKGCSFEIVQNNSSDGFAIYGYTGTEWHTLLPTGLNWVCLNCGNGGRPYAWGYKKDVYYSCTYQGTAYSRIIVTGAYCHAKAMNGSLDDSSVHYTSFSDVLTYSASKTSVTSSANKYSTSTSISNASTTSDGFMSAADYTRLHDIAEHADVNVQSDWNETNESSDAFIKNKPEFKSLTINKETSSGKNAITYSPTSAQTVTLGTQITMDWDSSTGTLTITELQ